MTHLGDFAQDKTVRIPFYTKVGGVPTAPSSALEAADFKIYKNGSATQKTTTNGVTITSPFDSITGFHLLEIDTSNDTGDGGFWVGGADYFVVLDADETLGGLALGGVVGIFSIENRSALRPATADRTLAVEADGMAHADLKEWLGVAPLALASQRVVTDVGAISGDATSADNLESYTDGSTPIPSNVTQFGGSAGTFAGGRPEVNASHIGGSAISQSGGVANVNVTQISGDAAAADNLESYTDGTTPMPVNATQISGDATAADNLEAAADGSGFNLGAGQIVAASVTGNVGGNVAGSVGSVTGNVGGNVTGSVGSVAAGGITAPSFGADALTAAKVAADVGAEIAAAVRSELTTELGRIDVSTSTRASQASVDALDDFVDTEVAAIKAKTDNLPADPADASDIAAAFATVTSALATIAGYIDTEVAAIKAATDQLVSAQAEPSSVPVANATPLVKLAWLAALARNKVTQSSTTQALRNDADNGNIATAGVSDDGSTFTRNQWQ